MVHRITVGTRPYLNFCFISSYLLAISSQEDEEKIERKKTAALNRRRYKEWKSDEIGRRGESKTGELPFSININVNEV